MPVLQAHRLVEILVVEWVIPTCENCGIDSKNICMNIVERYQPKIPGKRPQDVFENDVRFLEQFQAAH